MKNNFIQFLYNSKINNINSLLDELDIDEIDRFGAVLYDMFFDTDDNIPEEDEFTRSDIDTMVNVLGVYALDDIIYYLEEDDEYVEAENAEIISADMPSDGIGEAVSRIMKNKNINRKKRRFMQNSKAMMRKTAAKRKRENRLSRVDRKRYYRANKVKIKAYQKSRGRNIASGKHKIKLRRKSG